MNQEFESLSDNMFKDEQIDKDLMQNITGGQTGYTHHQGRNTYVMQNGDHVGGIDTSDGKILSSDIVEGWR